MNILREGMKARITDAAEIPQEFRGVLVTVTAISATNIKCIILQDVQTSYHTYRRGDTIRITPQHLEPTAPPSKDNELGNFPKLQVPRCSQPEDEDVEIL